MARSIWRGSVSFGMVNIPIRLYLATESGTTVSFNLLCPEHRSRIKNKRWCAEGDHEVPWKETVRAYEHAKGEYVLFDDGDLDKLPLRSSKTIDIAGFIKDDELPGPLYFQSAYYLEPDAAAAKPYALLRRTLEKTGRIAIAKFALRERERLVSLRAHDGALVMNTLHWPDEIRSTEDLELPEDVTVNAKELAMATTLVEAMATEFDPSEFKDEYRTAVLQVVRAKVEGREDLVEAPDREAETTPIDLMATLKASVERYKATGARDAAPRGRAASKSTARRAGKAAKPEKKERTARRKAS